MAKMLPLEIHRANQLAHNRGRKVFEKVKCQSQDSRQEKIQKLLRKRLEDG